MVQPTHGQLTLPAKMLFNQRQPARYRPGFIMSIHSLYTNKNLNPEKIL